MEILDLKAVLELQIANQVVVDLKIDEITKDINYTLIPIVSAAKKYCDEWEARLNGELDTDLIQLKAALDMWLKEEL